MLYQLSYGHHLAVASHLDGSTTSARLSRYPGQMRGSAEVVVVGGGIIGCSIAAELAAAGTDVVLLERHEIAHGASGRNHGLVYWPQNAITGPLFDATVPMYRELASRSRVQIGMDERPMGLVVLAESDSDWALAEAEAEACRIGGVPVQRWSREELRAAEPNVAEHFEGAWLIHDGYRLDPQALTVAYALEASEHGAQIVTNADVKQVAVMGDRAGGVITDQGLVEAEVVVLAAGPWAAKLARTAGVNLQISGARGWLLLSSPAEPVCSHLLESAGWHLTSGEPGPPEVTVGSYGKGDPIPTHVGMLLQPVQGGQLLMGGSRIASLRQDPEGPEAAREIARRAAAVLPILADAPISSVWSGVRPMSKDGLPLIGWAPGVEGLFICGGHGGQGVMLGGGSARLAAQMIVGARAFTDPAPFEVGRA